MRFWSTRTALLAAGAAAALTLLGGVPAEAAPATVTDDRFQRVSAAVAGPLEGGGTFAALVDGFAFTGEDGRPAAAASTDFFFGTVECLTDSSDVQVSIGPRLRTATLAGTTTGTCFDFATSTESTFTARFSLTWTAVGPLETERTVTRTDGRMCRTTILTREATATGTLTWSAPELGIGGTGTPTGASPLLDRCVTPNPGR